MWCLHCQADVAAVASADNQRACCFSCGHELLVAPAHRGGEASATAEISETSVNPQDLLAKWAQEDALEAQHPLPPVRRKFHDMAAATSLEPDPAAGGPSPSLRRFDQQHPQHGVPLGESTASPVVTPAPATMAASPAIAASAVTVPAPVHAPTPPRLAEQGSARDLISHPEHALANPPHFDATALLARKARANRGSSWVTLAGQLSAYLGVGTLTVGACLVLRAYFGGPESYAPTGWLVTTLGQMLLFLGVITLVSGGMEQTTQEVSTRIDTLGAQILKMEHYRASQSPPEVPAASTDTHVA